MTATYHPPTGKASGSDTALPTVGSGSQRSRRDTKCLLASRYPKKAMVRRSGVDSAEVQPRLTEFDVDCLGTLEAGGAHPSGRGGQSPQRFDGFV